MKRRNQNFKRLLLLNHYLQHLRETKLALMMLVTLKRGKNKRTIWALRREERWFNELWENRHNENYRNRWRADFRMSGQTFEKLVNLLRPFLQRQDTFFRSAIPVEKRVAVALWRLANGNSYRTVSKH